MSMKAPRTALDTPVTAVALSSVIKTLWTVVPHQNISGISLLPNFFIILHYLDHRRHLNYKEIAGNQTQF